MTTYNSYAVKLDRAFKAAREAYTSAYEQLKTAQQRFESAKVELKDDIELSMFDVDFRRAEAIFKKTDANCWPAFNTVVDELTKELEEVVAADSLAVPEDIDSNALTLLESGILRPAELENLRLRFEGNSTMTRFVARYAGEAAKKEEDRHKREQLTMTQKMAEDELDGVLRRWNDLLEAAKVCSGQSRDRQEDPGFVTKISQKWEELTADAIENF